MFPVSSHFWRPSLLHLHRTSYQPRPRKQGCYFLHGERCNGSYVCLASWGSPDLVPCSKLTWLAEISPIVQLGNTSTQKKWSMFQPAVLVYRQARTAMSSWKTDISVMAWGFDARWVPGVDHVILLNGLSMYLPWKSNHPFFIGWFIKTKFSKEGFIIRNQHFVKWWLTSRGFPCH